MKGRRSRDELRQSMTQAANATRDTADEMARQFDGCDDPTHPWNVNVFRDWIDFVDRVARPLVETEDHATEQEAMRLYRQASPYFICAALVMASNRLDVPAADTATEQTCPVCGGPPNHTAQADGSCVPAADTATPVIDAAHLAHQRKWSTETFGPGRRTGGVLDHIRKELDEIEDDPNDLSEWVDVVILALDGAWRHGWEPQQIIDAIKAKQAKNEARTWPDWRTLSEDQAIEHDRSAVVPAADTDTQDRT